VVDIDDTTTTTSSLFMDIRTSKPPSFTSSHLLSISTENILEMCVFTSSNNSTFGFTLFGNIYHFSIILLLTTSASTLNYFALSTAAAIEPPKLQQKWSTDEPFPQTRPSFYLNLLLKLFNQQTLLMLQLVFLMKRWNK